MPDYRGWEVVRPLGAGGQGEVFLVRSPVRASARETANTTIRNMIPRLNGIGDADKLASAASRLADAVITTARMDAPTELGALKQYKVTDDSAGHPALQRLKNEVKALSDLKGVRGVLQLLEADEIAHWTITEFHPSGSLSKYPGRFHGDAIGVLAALKPIVSVLAGLHKSKVVHRDIKTQNILVSSSGDLVLGDFGIVFLESNNRPTESLERVGSRDWMAPWANTGMRVDEIRPSFDVFPLGKVIWCLVSGKPMLPFWYHRRPEYDLTQQFPDDPAMHALNELLDHCVVESEKDCFADASGLLTSMEQVLQIVKRGGPFSPAIPLQCRVCGRGYYKRVDNGSIPLSQHMAWINVWVYICNVCGHVQTFATKPPK